MKAKRILSALLVCAMLFSCIGMTAMAAAETTATIKAFNASMSETYTGMDLATAISSAGPGGKVVISEGVVALPTGAYVQNVDGITIEGAGIDKTIITVEDPEAYRTALKGKDSTAEYNARRMLEVIADNVTIKNMTIDGSGVQGQQSAGFFGIGAKNYDFVPLKISGTYGSSTPINVTLENLKFTKEKATKGGKGFIQIGTNKDSQGNGGCANVIAKNVYIEGNALGSAYADVDFGNYGNSSLTVDGGAFSGIILANPSQTVTFNGNGYYKATKSTYAFYTTIPYVVDCYKENQDSAATYAELLKQNLSESSMAITAMTADLTNADVRLYNLDCDGKRDLAVDFKATLEGIQERVSDFGTVAATPIANLDAALANEDWHTWEVGEVVDNKQTYECSVCEATKEESIEVPEVIIGENENFTVEGVEEVTEEVKEAISTVINNSAVADFDGTNIAEATGNNGASIKIQLESAKVENSVVKAMAFDVKPVDANGETIDNSVITSNITFRLPVDNNAVETKANVYHENELLDVYDVQTVENEKFIEIAASEFSVYSYELIDETAKWATDTDAGAYFDADGKTWGMMRFLFAYDIDESKIANSGIKYLKSSNITDYVANEVTVSGKSAAFFGDIVGIEEEKVDAEATYYAVAYIQTTDNEWFWSDALGCKPNFEKVFDNYTPKTAEVAQ